MSIMSIKVLSFTFQRHFRRNEQPIISKLRPQLKQSLQQQQNLELSTGYVPPDTVVFPEDIGDEWELDCYSRPVQTADNKKLWEVLITDNTGKFRYVKPIPSNVVNSRTLRKIIEDLIEISPKKPRTIRFFRKQMLNMITIALNALDIEIKPSRSTVNLLHWLQERENYLYPQMAGYSATLKQQTILDYEVSQAQRLPDVFRAKSYAFVALPAEVFWNQEINKENMKKGQLCALNGMPTTGWIHGLTLFSPRADSIAKWFQGLEMSGVKADLLARELYLNCDIAKQYTIAPLNEQQKKESKIFEKGKKESNGFHFLSIQFEPNAEEVEGFWLLREFPDTL
jgi:hypothetical protein